MVKSCDIVGVRCKVFVQFLQPGDVLRLSPQADHLRTVLLGGTQSYISQATFNQWPHKGPSPGYAHGGLELPVPAVGLR